MLTFSFSLVIQVMKIQKLETAPTLVFNHIVINVKSLCIGNKLLVMVIYSWYCTTPMADMVT